MGLMKLLGTSFSTILNGGNPTADRTITFPDASGEALLKGTTLTLMTAQNSTSGTSIDFTGIPSWAKRITVMFNGVSTNGVSAFILQIGNGSVVTTGYASGVQFGTTYNSSGNAFILLNSLLAVDGISGQCVINLLGGNTWVSSSVMNRPGSALMCGTGSIPLAGTLDRIRITTVNGTDTFDAGSINVMYEG